MVGWMGIWMVGWVYRRFGGQMMDGLGESMLDVWLDGWKVGWIGWLDGWMFAWMDGRWMGVWIVILEN